jgi:Fe-S cluster assembly protein SufD
MSETATAVRASILDRVLRDYRACAADLPGDAAMRAARARAATRLHELGWPSTRDEHWRYTNLRAFDGVDAFSPRGAAMSPPATTELPPELPGFQRLIFVDGQRVAGVHPMLTAPAEAAPAPPAWPPEQRLGLLADMFAADSARLLIRGDAAIELLFVSTAGTPSYPRIDIQVERDSQLRLVERHLSQPPITAPTPGPGQTALVACNVTLELAPHAALTHYRLQQCRRDTVFTDTLSARLSERARYTVRSIAVGAGSARTSADVQLAGRGAALAWASIAVGRGEQVHDLALKVEHAAPETTTDELFRGLADERARVAFSGHIQIGATAPASQARQSLRGLIEGAAEIDLRPRLEILTDDVRASHGATTGRLDEDLLFYLLARGIDRGTARALLKWAFLGDVLRQIEQPALRAEAERLAAGQLPDVPSLGAL